jgi:hypothetical protein
VKILQFLIDGKSSSCVLQHLKPLHPDAANLSNSAAIEILLNLVIRKPTSGEPLRSALTILKITEIVSFLGYLKSRVCEDYLVPTEKLKDMFPDFKVPTTTHAITWLNALIDSQLAAILFSKECNAIIIELSRNVKEQITFTSELRSMAGQLWNYLNRKEDEIGGQGSYTIERFII